MFCVVSASLAILQVYKVQEAVGDGASAVIQEVATGTSQVFSSMFDGINNTVKVSMFLIGSCFVYILGHWLQAMAFTWWITKGRQGNAAIGDDDTPATTTAALPHRLAGEEAAWVDEQLAREPTPNHGPTTTLALADRGAACSEDTVVTPEEPRTVVQLGPGGPATGRISGLTLEQIARVIWLRSDDGRSFRKGWFEEINSLLVPGTVEASSSVVGVSGYKQYAFSVNAVDKDSKKSFTVRMSAAIESISRSTDLSAVALRDLITCSCEQYERCKKCIPGDLGEEWPGIYRDVVCKHCVVVLLFKLIAQTYPGMDYRESLARWKMDKKNWPLSPGERELGNESRDVYVTAEGLKVGLRANFNSDLYKLPGSKPKTIYVSTDPYDWIRELPFPSERELARIMSCFSALKLKANTSRGRRDVPNWYHAEVSRVLAYIERDVPENVVFHSMSDFVEPKQLLRDQITGLLRSGKANDSRRDNAWLRGEYGSVTLRRFKALDSSAEVVSSVECDGNSAALIGREQALAETSAVVLCYCGEEPTTRCIDIIITLLLVLERKAGIIVLMNQEMMRRKNDFTEFLIRLQEAETVAVMITPERFASQIICLGLKIRVASEYLLDDIERVGQDRRGYSRSPTPTQLFKEAMSLDGQTQASDRGVSMGSVSISKALPSSLVSWFEKIMARSLPLNDWMSVVNDRRDPQVDYGQRYSLSLSRTQS